MNFNNQELNSFLTVPSDSQDQIFPNLSPQRSGSPRSIMSDQQQLGSTTSSLGGFRTRARAGTLPSRFQPSYSPALHPTSSSGSHHNFDPNTLNMENLTISPAVLDPIPLGNVQSNGANGSRTRLRSGSLLGLSESNSIWNDSSSNLGPNNNQLHHQSSIPSLSSVNLVPSNNNKLPLDYTTRGTSPPKQPFVSQQQPIEEHPNNRVRAYSTNNVLINDNPTNFYLQNINEENTNIFQQQHPPQQHFNQLHPQNLPQQDQLNGYDFSNRPRAQTFQNGVQNSLPILFNPQSQTQPQSLINEISEIPETNRFSPKLLLSNDQPLLLDNIDPRLLNWTSTYQDSSLGPSNTLFLSNLPSQSVTSVSLANLLMKFGRVVTLRIFSGNESAIAEFETLEAAMQAKAQLNHQELMPGFACLVTFAKVLPIQQQENIVPKNNNLNNSPPFQSTNDTPNIQVTNVLDQGVVDIVNTISENPAELKDITNDIFDIVSNLGVDPNGGSIHHIVLSALKYKGFDNDFGPLPDPIPIRDFDAPKLRETRKLIDANSMAKFEIEELSLAILDELPELASDYLGNTVVQKLFEFSSTSIKHIMLKEVSPYLAQMGIHKNGTWSAQKMITVADSPIQKNLVAESLKPYCVPLLNDQFGNYVIQCSLKFGPLWNDFIFEVILAKFWLIAQNRFGSRAVRACLESHEASVEQTAIISAAIILHAEHLAINQNAALLITWFLDTCTLPNRHLLLTPRLLPHLAQLCTHKLASLTILKILNNRYEDEAKNVILTALFGPVFNDDFNDSKAPAILEQILQDNVHGATFVFKVLSNPQLNNRVRKNIITQVRSVLLEMNVSSYQGYKRLMDEIGLSNRSDSNRHTRSHSNGGTSSRNKGRQGKSSPQNPSNRRSTPNGYRQTQTNNNSQQQQQQQQQPQQHSQQQQNYQQLPPPAPPQFISAQNEYSNDFQQGQYYQSQLPPLGSNNQYMSDDGFFQAQPQGPPSQQHQQQHQHGPSSGVFNDQHQHQPYQTLSNQYNNGSNSSYQSTAQFGYGSAQY